MSRHRLGQAQQPQGVATADRDLPTPLGRLLLGETVLVHQSVVALRLLHGVQISRWRFSIIASSMAVRSSASMTTAGISVSPASRAARHRRSPAMIW